MNERFTASNRLMTVIWDPDRLRMHAPTVSVSKTEIFLPVAKPGDTAQRMRKAANEHRRRVRQSRGQGVYRCTANRERLINLLVRLRYLPDGIQHSHAMLEQALTVFIDDEGRRMR